MFLENPYSVYEEQVSFPCYMKEIAWTQFESDAGGRAEYAEEWANDKVIIYKIDCLDGSIFIYFP